MTMTSPARAPHSVSSGSSGPALRDARLVRDATGRLLAAAARLGGEPGGPGDPGTSDDALAAPSRLPGWSRGHVLAHLARNADALVEILAGRPMYAGENARDADIERDAHRPLAAHLDDLRDSAARLDGAFAAQREADWERPVTLRNGVTDSAAGLPFRRWIEVELHHVDLGAGYGVEDLPGAFLDRQLVYMARRFAGHPALPQAVELRTEDGVRLPTGAGARPDGQGGGTVVGAGGSERSGGGDRAGAVVVTGGAAALVGWLTGRTPGSGLSASSSLPPLPPL